jgi:hypothetical protein
MTHPKPISRQRRHQLARQAAGLCILCASPRVTRFFCLAHAIQVREKHRQERGNQRRNKSLTYRLEQNGATPAALRTEAEIKSLNAQIRQLRQRLAA